MTAYAIAHLREVDFGPEIVEYLERIDATLEPFGGYFVIHGGGDVDVLEGESPGDVVVIAFPDRERARAWYDSPAYQAILSLRTANSRSTALLVDGVPPEHRATEILEQASG